MFFEIVRYADRSFRHRDIGPGLLRGLVNATLDLSHFFKVLIEPAAVRRRQLLLKAGDLSHDRIQQTDRLLSTRFALSVRAAVSEQSFEHNLRAVLHG